jgi:hypothetical protein
MRTDFNSLGHQTGKSRYASSTFLGRIIGTAAIILVAGSSAFGEFLVQPMKIQIPVQPGKRFTTEFKLENLDRTVTETIGLRIVELTQRSDGGWLDFNSDDPNIDQSNLASCASWLSFDKDTADVRPLTIEPIKIKIEVPPGTRGYYFAAVQAQSAPRPGVVEGVTTEMAIQFVIPVILEVTGRPMRHQIELTDVGLEFLEETENRPALCLASMDIRNDGGTYSRLAGMWRIWHQVNGRWRKVGEMKYTDMGIIPGVQLHLTQNIGKPLISGTYKVEGFLMVDNRRSGQTEKILEFKGDTKVNSTSPDADLEVGTREVVTETLPGGARATSIMVVNPSDDPVVVNADLILPEHMGNRVSAKGIAGEDFGCAEWVTVEPRQFTLQGHGRQNLRIAARMPATATLPNYYGAITLAATYADGQTGGITRVPLCVHNKKAENTIQINKMVFTISQSTPSRYFVTARFMNTGDTHVVPTCKAVVTTAGSSTAASGLEVARFTLRSEGYDQTTMLMPLDVRNFTGVLDVSGLEVGTYRLTAVMEYGKKQGENFQDQIAIDVIEQGGGKEVQVTDMSRVGGKTVINL